MRIRSSGFLYKRSPSLTSKALYQASIFTGAPIDLNLPGECVSVIISCASVWGKVFPRQICAKARKKRWSGVNPSIFFPLFP